MIKTKRFERSAVTKVRSSLFEDENPLTQESLNEAAVAQEIELDKLIISYLELLVLLKKDKHSMWFFRSYDQFIWELDAIIAYFTLKTEGEIPLNSGHLECFKRYIKPKVAHINRRNEAYEGHRMNKILLLRLRMFSEFLEHYSDFL